MLRLGSFHTSIGQVSTSGAPYLSIRWRRVAVTRRCHSGYDRGGGDVAAPPEDRLVPGCQCGRHEAELQERAQTDGEVGVDHLVEVEEGVPHLGAALPLVLPVDPDVVAEHAVTADELEADVALAVPLAQGEVHPAGADAP